MQVHLCLLIHTTVQSTYLHATLSVSSFQLPRILLFSRFKTQNLLTISSGQLAWAGLFKNGVPFGDSWKRLDGGGFLYGAVETHGQFGGSKNAYIYPDMSTALVGIFSKGKNTSHFSHIILIYHSIVFLKCS